MSDLLWPIACVLLGLLMLALEMFIPSGGVLGVLAFLLLLGGVVSSFSYGGLGVGTVFTAGTSIAAGLAIFVLIRWWPETRIGKMILTKTTPPEELVPDRSRLKSMIGRIGQARSLMLPGGVIEIEGDRFDAIGIKTIERGTWVQVTGIQANDLIVKPIDHEVGRRSVVDASGRGNPSQVETLQDPFEEPLG